MVVQNQGNTGPYKDNGEEIKDLIDDKAKLVLPKADTGMQNIKDYRKSCVII